MSDTISENGALCECGCGGRTSTYFNKVRRFIHGHQSAKNARAFKGDENVLKKCQSCTDASRRRDFSRHNRSRDGRQATCKACTLALQRDIKARRKKAGRPSYHQVGRRKLRLTVLTHYSGGVPACACCGEQAMEFLAIDHIHGGGRQHRLLRGNARIYSWLKNNDYPDGYRVLCHNCNQSRGIYGYCPHEVRDETA